MQKQISDVSELPGARPALIGVVLSGLGGLFLAQAGGSDRELFLSVAFVLGSCGLLGIVVGGVAIGIQIARD
jgi:hypothetical protein